MIVDYLVITNDTALCDGKKKCCNITNNYVNFLFSSVGGTRRAYVSISFTFFCSLLNTMATYEKYYGNIGEILWQHMRAITSRILNIIYIEVYKTV